MNKIYTLHSGSISTAINREPQELLLRPLRQESSAEQRRREECMKGIISFGRITSTHSSTGTISGEEETRRVHERNYLLWKNYYHALFDRNHQRRRGDEKCA
ncbi:hypothetical protein JTE90_012746 [Oedothorax gibbosus]|uniref:Uncharacterized protein n=1 Tax=Oedothorax gibbosus TaxID=931172 RepID=A0AAV6VZZ7_9ARAC|nr:hypothetical protein JTE90_012746 [Oedothorax gibbosus]